MRLFEKVKEVWRELDQMPNCPVCKGTGEPTGKYKNWAETVWWKGRLYKVCHNCLGRGKV